MVKHLLPQRTYYKACLHTHSTCSDGKLTPEEVRDAYKAKGYSILALTDHSVMVEHQALNQEDFLMLTGVEIDIADDSNPNKDLRGRERHFCLISKDPKRMWVPFKDPYPIPSSVPYEKLNEFGGLPREYSAESINAIIAECNRQGCLVTYNHPCWSLESYPDYAPMEGLWGLEYRNSACVAEGYDENNTKIYQDLLMLGKFVMPVCADDTHRPIFPNGFPTLGNSFNMIGAEALTYESVIDAMEKGDLYASCGPLIHSLTWDGAKVRITCSPAVRVQLLTHARQYQMAIPQEGSTLTEAEFDMSRFLPRYRDSENAFLRLVVTAEDGSYAVTRAYRIDELK